MKPIHYNAGQTPVGVLVIEVKRPREDISLVAFNESPGICSTITLRSQLIRTAQLFLDLSVLGFTGFRIRSPCICGTRGGICWFPLRLLLFCLKMLIVFHGMVRLLVKYPAQEVRNGFVTKVHDGFTTKLPTNIESYLKLKKSRCFLGLYAYLFSYAKLKRKNSHIAFYNPYVYQRAK